MECSGQDLALLVLALVAPRSLFGREEGILATKAYRFEDRPARRMARAPASDFRGPGAHRIPYRQTRNGPRLGRNSSSPASPRLG
jgi:hypothetical protein